MCAQSAAAGAGAGRHSTDSLAEGAVTLVEAGKSRATIYHAPLHPPCDEDPRPFEQWSRAEQDRRYLADALADLKYHLEKISGATLDVVVTGDPAEVQSPAIVVGALANAMGATPDENASADSDETFRLQSDGDGVRIGGQSDMAAVYGIYEMLGRLGCDWVMPGPEGEVLPRCETVQFPRTDVQQRPSFKLHTSWYSGFAGEGKRLQGDFRMWQLRQKQQPRDGRRMTDFRVGGHSWGNLIRKYKEAFEANPELLALVRQDDGSMKRSGPQIETTHPEVIDLAVRYVREMFEENGWPRDKRVCIPMGPSDGSGMSESTESLLAGVERRDAASGQLDGTDLVVLFCNTILERLGDAYPNLHLGFFLYSWHTDYPIRYKPHPRLAIEIADINFSRFHGIGDQSSKSRALYADILEQWGRLHREQGNVMYCWKYGFNLADGYLPMTKLKIWGEDFPVYKRLGVSGMRLNINADWALHGPHYYLGARLAWDVNGDWREILRTYCQGAFGKGAAMMERYFLTLADRQATSGHEAGSFHAHPLIYDRKFIAQMEELLAAAREGAEQPIEKTRVDHAGVAMANLKRFLEFHEDCCRCDFVAASKSYQRMQEGIDRDHQRNEQLIGNMAKRFLSGYETLIEQGVKYSTSEYRIVHRIPDKLKAAFDPNMIGQNLRYFGKHINDRDYPMLSTFTSTWDAQGLAGYRRGAVWYRVWVDIPSALASEAFGLFIGGVDNQVRVWCNEQFVGHGSKWLRHPLVFDLTDALEPGKENLLALQVMRTRNNELGTGGIAYPAFIFAGPRLDGSSASGERPYRVLPGGIVETQ